MVQYPGMRPHWLVRKYCVPILDVEPNEAPGDADLMTILLGMSVDQGNEFPIGVGGAPSMGNQMILESLDVDGVVRIVDLDVKHGYSAVVEVVLHFSGV